MWLTLALAQPIQGPHNTAAAYQPALQLVLPGEIHQQQANQQGQKALPPAGMSDCNYKLIDMQ